MCRRLHGIEKTTAMKNETIFLASMFCLILLVGLYAVVGKVFWPDDPLHAPLQNVYPNTSHLSNDAIVPDESFIFQHVEGHFETGFNMLRVRGNGNATYLVHVPIQNPRSIEQRLARFTLSENELTNLGNELRAAKFADMPDGYSTQVADGAFVSMHVVCQGQRKDVTCDNYFPDDFVTLNQYVIQHVLAPNQPAIDQAQPISYEEADKLFKLEAEAGQAEPAGSS